MSIVVSHVTKCYGKQKALNDVSFSLTKGEICGFLGPNGAGKSTLMKIITGFLYDYEGDVHVDGIPVRKRPLEAKMRIGYLPEHNPLYTEMYIKEYLVYVARLYRVKHVDKRVDEIVGLTGLQPEIGKRIGQLSKGYRQRVGLAQALVHDPEVLILDEPMTGLDPNQLEDIRNLILDVGRDKTILLSTHIMQEVEAICNRIIVVDQGNIVADKSKDEFRMGTLKEMCIKIRFAPGTLPSWLDSFEQLSSVTHSSLDVYHVVAQPGEDPRIALFNEAAKHHTPIIEMKPEDHNLEETFRVLTDRK